MPELSPRKGWTQYKALTDITEMRDGGPIADTPAQGLQWYYLVNDDVDPGLRHFGMNYEIYSPSGTLLMDASLVLPILVTPAGGGWPAVWSIQNARVEVSYPDPVRVWHNETDQPLVMPLNKGNLLVYCEVYSAPYLIDLPAGSIWHVSFHNIYAMDLTFAPILTSVLPQNARKRMLIDPVTHDQVLPRIIEEMLIVRSQLHDGAAGPREGLACSYESGVVTVTAGMAVIGYQELRLAAPATLAVGTTGTHYIYLVSDPDNAGRLILQESDGPLAVAAWCLGRVKSGRYTAAGGVLVADGVSEAAPGRREDGTMVLRYDTSDADDVEAVSYDRGVTWATN
jgi:hypothetical protein